MMYSRLFLQKSCIFSYFKYFRTTVAFKNIHSVSSKSLLKSYTPTVTHVRAFWETFPSFRPLFYEKDGLSRDKYELIYHARIFNYVFWAQLGAFTFGAAEIYGGLKYIYKLLFPPEAADVVTHLGLFVLDATSLPSIIALTLFNIQGIIMVITAQNAILRVYICEETGNFVFVKLRLNPFKTRLLHCKPGELYPLEESPFSFFFGNHKLNREKLFIRTDNFKSTHLYNTLLPKDHK